MKIFDDMTFSGSPEALVRFIDRLDQSQQIGIWSRDLDAEERHALVRPARNTERCYRATFEVESPDALLWMFADRGRASQWRVTNIVPAESNRSFSEATYHRLLVSFREATLPLTTDFKIAVSLPKLDVGPEYWLNPKQEALLRAFSEHANRSTGAAHPRDRERWNAFVIAMHRDGSPAGGCDIERILFEHEHWPERMAHELAIDFDKEIALLRDFAKSA